LHVDAFPSRPIRGERILRVFTNIHPDSTQARVWRVGEPFEDIARRYLPFDLVAAGFVFPTRCLMQP
jgi:hypothetical protein